MRASAPATISDELARRRRTCGAARSGRARGCRRSRSSSGSDTSPSASSTCFTSSATCTVSGSRRRRTGRGRTDTKSGRSGRSTREYQAFRSMQPMFTIQSSASSSLTSGVVDPLRFAAPSRVETGTRRALDPVRHVRRRVLLEEELALPAVGVALHRERPVAQVRHEHGRDVAVVREQVALRDPLVRPERLVEVRELQHARPRRISAGIGLLATHLVRRLVLAQALERRRPQPAVVRPLRELDLADELRLDPDDVALPHLRHLRHLLANGVSVAQRLELRHQLGDVAVREAGAALPT